jgi:hypothetical protein
VSLVVASERKISPRVEKSLLWPPQPKVGFSFRVKNFRSVHHGFGHYHGFYCPVKNLPIVPWALGWGYDSFRGNLNVKMVGAEPNTPP